MDKLLDVKIITPAEVLYEGKAISVTVPGTKSPFQVLYNHAPIVSSLELGTTKIVDDSNQIKTFKTSNGFIEVRANQISILVDSAKSI